MTIIDGTTEQELIRLWGIIGELSEELSRNRALSVTLYDQVGNAKVSCDRCCVSLCTLTMVLESGRPFSNWFCIASFQY
jgi:hypothetical protein